MKKSIRILLIAALWLGLASGILRAAVLPKSVNEYELRPAQQLPDLHAEDFFSGNYQQLFESALSDQFPLSQYMKKAYNLSSSAYLKALILPVAARDDELVVEYNGIRLYQGSMLYTPKEFDKDRGLYDLLADSYNRAMVALPETAFYFYFIESDAVHDYIGGGMRPTFDTLCGLLAVPDNQIGRLALKDFSDYQDCFLRTDHHWSAHGSYRGYLDLLELLEVEDPPLVPAGEKVFSGYAGSQAAGARLPTFTESVRVYFFDYPDLGQSYGNEALYWDDRETEFSYGIFYGGDEGEIVFDTGRPERDNLLVIGDSYDNAILKLLASHFGKTFSVDLRYYPSGEGGFDLPDYVRSHEIQKVLVIGSDFLFLDPTYSVRS